MLEYYQEVLDEMKRFRDALKKYYSSKDQSCVSFERNFKSQHLQMQVQLIHGILGTNKFVFT